MWASSMKVAIDGTFVFRGGKNIFVSGTIDPKSNFLQTEIIYTKNNDQF